ncbi:hypothetical protein RHGRI_011920 [Rhododendron griersonianum]|uniref:hAT-like transposase RNase-H fold domain-containing protein n=1 Tax=Rhododendron griersonianum TaxID=479676 RepID=A0AAV6KP62_9ERIC|nr:hypothetical protein RHGRI_011920 [Rhododendron griersonianum]
MVQRGLNPQYCGFSASTAKRDVMKHFKQNRDNLLSYFKNYNGKIYLTSDLWTSRSHMGDVLTVMRSKFDKYFKTLPLVFCFAIILDPRLKMDALEQWLRVLNDNESEVVDTSGSYR